jgi:hypothetical protein
MLPHVTTGRQRRDFLMVAAVIALARSIACQSRSNACLLHCRRDSRLHREIGLESRTTLKPTEQCGLDLGPPIRTPFAEINRMRLAPVTSMQSNQTCAVGQSVSIESVRKSASSHDRIVFAFFVFCPTIQA